MPFRPAIIAFLAAALLSGTPAPTDAQSAAAPGLNPFEGIPLDQPNIGTAPLMDWVSSAAAEVMSFSHDGYFAQLRYASRHFTREGWQSFMAAMETSRILESYERYQLTSRAVPAGPPDVLSQGIEAGVYMWIVEVPLRLEYSTGDESWSQNHFITVTLERLPVTEHPMGFGITRWVGAIE